MGILAGNLTSRIWFRLQFRVFSIPWVEKNPTILPLKGIRYSSSSEPFRYNPKIISKGHEGENSIPKTVFDSTRSDDVGRGCGSDKKSPSLSRTLNGSVLCHASQQELEKDIDQRMVVKDHKLVKDPRMVYEEILNQQEHDSSSQNTQEDQTMQNAEKFAIKLLAIRAYTAAELRKKLQGKRFPPAILDALITDFQKRGLINDGLYAETFSRSRWSSSSWGPRRIKQALLKRGINEADTGKALKLVFNDGESGEQESKVGLSKLCMDQLLVQASKQWLRGGDVPKEIRKTRIIRWLQYRGFNWAVISSVLKKLESQYSREQN